MRKVADICDKLMHDQATYGTYSLLTEGNEEGYLSPYEYLFTSGAEYNSEVILDYAAVELDKQWSLMYNMAPLSAGANLCQKAPSKALVDSYKMSDGSDPTDLNSYTGRDPRLKYTVAYNGMDWYDLNDKGEYVKKFTLNVTSGSDQAAHGLLHPQVFRPGPRQEPRDVDQLHHDALCRRAADVRRGEGLPG